VQPGPAGGPVVKLAPGDIRHAGDGTVQHRLRPKKTGTHAQELLKIAETVAMLLLRIPGQLPEEADALVPLPQNQVGDQPHSRRVVAVDGGLRQLVGVVVDDHIGIAQAVEAADHRLHLPLTRVADMLEAQHDKRVDPLDVHIAAVIGAVDEQQLIAVRIRARSQPVDDPHRIFREKAHRNFFRQRNREPDGHRTLSPQQRRAVIRGVVELARGLVDLLHRRVGHQPGARRRIKRLRDGGDRHPRRRCNLSDSDF